VLLKIYYSICITDSNDTVPVTHRWVCFPFKIIILPGWKAVKIPKVLPCRM